MGDVKKVGKKVFGMVKGATGMDSYKTPESKYDKNLMALVGTLEKRMRGESPSVAETQMKQSMQENVADTQSGIRSAAGFSPALRARMLSRAGEEGGRDLVKHGALLRAQEQAQAESTLGSILLGAKGADISKMGINAASHKATAGRRQDMLKDLMTGFGKKGEIEGLAKKGATGGMA